MKKFDFDDVVSATSGVPEARVGAKAWIVGITLEGDRNGSYYKNFAPGNLYTIEFEDGESTDVLEVNLVHWSRNS